MTIRVTRKKADAYQHGDLHEALVQAGLKLLAEGGPAALSLRAAAQLAGVSHAAPYRHFRDKQALVGAIAERGFRLLTASMRDEAARHESSAVGTPDARQLLLALGAGYVRFATRNPSYLQVMFGGVLGDQQLSAEQKAAGEEAYLTLRNAVADGITRGQLKPGDPDQLSLACWSLVHGLSMLIVNGAFPPPASASAERRMVTDLVGLLGSGLFTAGGRGARESRTASG